MLEWHAWAILKWCFRELYSTLWENIFFNIQPSRRCPQCQIVFLQRTYIPQQVPSSSAHPYQGVYPSYSSIIGIQYHRSPSQITQILELANRDNGLREGVGEYSVEYSPYSRNKPFTPILPVRTIFSPILYLPARLSRTLYSSRPPIRIYCPSNYNWWRPAIIPPVTSALAHRLRANPRIPEI
jgi:hypothetical protein